MQRQIQQWMICFNRGESMEKYINYFLKKDNSHCLYEKFDYNFDYKNATEEKFLL